MKSEKAATAMIIFILCALPLSAPVLRAQTATPTATPTFVPNGQYTFETFGDTMDIKDAEYGGLSPLPDAFILSGWFNSESHRLWQASASDSHATYVDDDYSFPIDINFDFNYYNSHHTQMKISDNFYASFYLTQENYSPWDHHRLYHVGAPYDSIFFFWNDGHIYAGRWSNPVVSTKTYGDEFGLHNTIVEWYQIQRNYGSNYVNYYTGWLRLYETTNIIEFYYFKSMSSTCYYTNCDADVGMQYGTYFDEPPTNPLNDPDCDSLWYNEESFHNGPENAQHRSGCNTCVGNCIPAVHYRFKPIAYSWDDVTYWPEDLNSVSGELPDWWSITNTQPLEAKWRYSSTGAGGITSGCMVTDANSSEELIATRPIDMSTLAYPFLMLNYEFVNDNNHNSAEILMTINGGPWQTLWTTQGSDSSGGLMLPLSGAAGEDFVQIGFKYSRDDTSNPDQIVFQAMMDTDPGADLIPDGTSGDEWQWTGEVTTDPIHFYHGFGPTTGYDEEHFYALDSGDDGYGSYNNGCHTWLDTRPIDCSGLGYVEVRFMRWLGVERSHNDQARFQISIDGGNTWDDVWSSTEHDIHICDCQWVEKRYDISSWAAGQSDVRLRWRLDANGSNVSCGWNLDNIQVLGLSYTPAGYFAIDDISFDEGPSPTPTATMTFTPSPTPTNTPTPTDTPTPTITPTPWPTGIPTWTPSPTATNTPFTPSTNTPTEIPTAAPPTSTPTVEGTSTPPTPALNCLNPHVLECGQTYEIEPWQGNMNVDTWHCLSDYPFFTGYENLFIFDVPEDGTYTIHQYTEGLEYIFLLRDDCSEFADCEPASNILTFDAAAGDQVYIVVDGPSYAEDTFTIWMECPDYVPVPTLSIPGLSILLAVLGFIFISSRRKR